MRILNDSSNPLKPNFKQAFPSWKKNNYYLDLFWSVIAQWNEKKLTADYNCNKFAPILAISDPLKKSYFLKLQFSWWIGTKNSSKKIVDVTFVALNQLQISKSHWKPIKFTILANFEHFFIYSPPEKILFC